MNPKKETTLSLPTSWAVAFGLYVAILLPSQAHAFCGFYVAKADTSLFNKASKVVVARKDDRTVVTMANDYQGEPEEFAIVVPVPTVLEKGQVHVGDPAVVDHLDAYTSPRLVEYFDDNPCAPPIAYMRAAPEAMADAKAGEARGSRAGSLGVTIEAEYTVGEYDIVLLSAKQSEGLATFLSEEGYKLPAGAAKILGSYIKQDLHFFLAKVNLSEQARLGFNFLRPLQIAYESPRFMLPIRLGTLNADGPQELFVYTLTSGGRVETTNYRTTPIPSDLELPMYVREEFGDFYRAMFDQAVKKERMKTVFLEYAWDMGWCDPCAADPLSVEELRGLGVFWLEAPPRPVPPRPMPRPLPGRPAPGASPQMMPPPMPVRDVFVTRLHVRYDAKNFPEDLFFQETGNRENFQGRFILTHAWEGDARTCPEAREYFKKLSRREEERARNLARLTGWRIGDIRARMKLAGAPPEDGNWWEELWPE